MSFNGAKSDTSNKFDSNRLEKALKFMLFVVKKFRIYTFNIFWIIS